MEDIDKAFVKNVRPGDIIVANNNFGCGSSREHAPVAIKASGISCVIASSFARIFYRNAINTGLAILECPEVYEKTSAGDTLEVDFDSGTIYNVTTGEQFHAQPFPPFIKNIMEEGGLLAALKKGGQNNG
jgi:3-isopropylmalate/(R)-2-methylmalate dehydratase small subunit